MEDKEKKELLLAIREYKQIWDENPILRPIIIQSLKFLTTKVNG